MEKYTIYLHVLTTGEIVCQHVVHKSGNQARINFLRRMRSSKTIEKGFEYRLEMYTGWRDLNDLPERLFNGNYIVTAR